MSNTNQMRKIQTVLQNIANGQKPFFNIQQYVNFGVVEWVNTYRVDNAGRKVVDGAAYRLTKKGRNFLNVLV